VPTRPLAFFSIAARRWVLWQCAASAAMTKRHVVPQQRECSAWRQRRRNARPERNVKVPYGNRFCRKRSDTEAQHHAPRGPATNPRRASSRCRRYKLPARPCIARTQRSPRRPALKVVTVVIRVSDVGHKGLNSRRGQRSDPGAQQRLHQPTALFWGRSNVVCVLGTIAILRRSEN